MADSTLIMLNLEDPYAPGDRPDGVGRHLLAVCRIGTGPHRVQRDANKEGERDTGRGTRHTGPHLVVVRVHDHSTGLDITDGSLLPPLKAIEDAAALAGWAGLNEHLFGDAA